jgi:ATP-dependent RNA helicase DeaD
VSSTPAAAAAADPSSSPAASGFSDLGLSPAILSALTGLGYEMPTPIQAATIPPLLSGSDVLGQAQTGTGKTAAFALPVLSKVNVELAQPQALVLVPTRELAIQVAEAFQSYAAHMRGFHVLPIYGGQSYTPQIKGLKRGAHVVVGTPGRIMDHMKRGTLDLSGLSFLVLDEADEMLQMGFVDDIEWILEQTPATRQVALFSATLPAAIRRIAQKHQRSPKEITIQSKTSTAANIRQRYWLVSGLHKLDALTRILEAETFDAMLIFVRTKLETVDLSDRLQARGFDAAPLNGDIPQAQRERTIHALKSGKVDIVVATDVAARGLDVERVSHVVNYDVPYDSESYIHRIGRTGRAGRNGEAILFIAPRERNMLRIIERATRQRIDQMSLPSIADVNEQRVARFKQRITAAIESGEGSAFRELIEQFEREQNVPAIEIAVALASLAQGGAPLLLPERAEEGAAWSRDRPHGDDSRGERRSGRAEKQERRKEKYASPEGQRGRFEPGREGGRERFARNADRAGGRGPSEPGARHEGGRGPSEAGARHEGGRGPSESGARHEGGRGPSESGARHEGVPGPSESGPRSEGGHERPGRDASRREGRQDRFERRAELPAESSQPQAQSSEHHPEFSERGPPRAEREQAEHVARAEREQPGHDERGEAPARKRRGKHDISYETFRIEVGHVHGVKPGNIVGAIANEAGLEGRHIGHVDIREDHSFVDLPEGMPKEIFRSLKKVRVVGRELQIALAHRSSGHANHKPHRPSRHE